MQLRTSLLTLVSSVSLLGAAAGCSGPAETPSRCGPGLRETGFGCVVDPRVAVNSVGYLPDRVKRASVLAQVDAFQLRDAAGEVVFEGSPTGPVADSDSEADVWVLDFTEHREPGEYYITVDGPEPFPESVRFRIGEDVYEPLLHALMLGMTGQRCGEAVSVTWEDVTFAHGACHLEDGDLSLVGGTGQRDLTGGWHDAGDYGKYMVNGAFASGMMLKAWEHFPERLRDRAFELPETGDDVPDYLDENRVNLDWILKMQNEDGSVVHKVTPKNFPGFLMPEMDGDIRYVSDWGSAGTGDFVAVMAQAARIYAELDPEFSARCLAAAEKSFAFLQEHPELYQPSSTGFVQMQYNTRSDADDRVWGACELWETSGADAALAACEAALPTTAVGVNWDWDGLGTLAVITYVLSEREDRDRRDQELLDKKTTELLGVADRMVTSTTTNAWGLAYTGGRYWGVNGVYARTAHVLRAAHRIDPKPEYLDAITQQIDHLLGRNYYARSQVTGVGFAPPIGPHHRPSGADGIAPPWPGLLIGGAQPTARDWSDDPNDAQTGENAINWNAPLIYAVAGFLP